MENTSDSNDIDDRSRLPDAPQIRAYISLLAAANLIQQVVDADLRERVGLTHPQFEILARLGEAPDGIRMNHLAEGLILSRSGTTYRVQQLEAAGLVRRESDPHDDRGIVAHLTDSGAALLEKAMPGHEALVQELVFDALEEKQLAAMDEALRAVLRRIVERGAAEQSGSRPSGSSL